MMLRRALVRDVGLVCLAVAAGWWGRSAGWGAGTAVLAGSNSTSSSSSSRGSGGDGGLAFQLSTGGPQASLMVYNPDNHTLYVYPRVGLGNSHISCEYSLTMSRAGAPIDRQNCPVGELVR